MRAHALSTTNAGMTRLRTKGKASQATLYDCLNAYITIAGTIKPRPGTVIDTILPGGGGSLMLPDGLSFLLLPDGVTRLGFEVDKTVGLVAHNGKQVVFSHAPVTMTDDRYVNVVLRHPSDATVALRAIHYAKPFMGYLYVVAAFDDGSQWHYWAEELDAWEADKIYMPGDRVFPTEANGYAYKATRPGSPAPQWAAGVERALNDVIEPTTSNGYDYTVIAVTGNKPASGTTEPDWPTEDGATVIEESLDAGGGSDTPTPGDDGDDSDVPDRYRNPGGSKPPSWGDDPAEQLP